jgi:hypothetical protein
MTFRQILVSGLVALATVAALSSVAGCSETIRANLTKERTGNISIQFNNTTPYAAAFSYGTWDAWDNFSTNMGFDQLRVGPNATSTVATLACARNMAVGTDALVERVLETETDTTTADFDPDLFDTVVRFSRAADGTDAGNLPTEGTAAGVELLLGVDYSCADQIIITFVEDPDAAGGFRIDVEVILDATQS